MSYAWTLARLVTALVLAFVFALAGVAKLLDPTETLVFMQLGLGVGVEYSRWVVNSVAFVEIALAIWLTCAFGRSIRPGLAALAVIGFFMGLLAQVVHRHPSANMNCGCFGALQPPFGGMSILGHFQLDGMLTGFLILHIAIVHFSLRRDRRANGGCIGRASGVARASASAALQEAGG